jgi:hypothetical protein
LALTSMAAKVEKKTTSTPSPESIAIIDDVLSLSSGIKFFGTTTTSYKNPRDPNNGSFCTIPVKYEFHDKDTRFRAEKVLRKTCNVNCSTPYPTILRECIKRTVAKVKREFPDNFVKVTVDTTKLCLKVSHKPSGNAEDRVPWNFALEDIPLPREALDVRAKKIPENLTIADPTFANKKSPPEGLDNPVDMVVENNP